MASRGWGVLLLLVLLTGCATGVPVGHRLAAGALRYQPRIGPFPGAAGREGPRRPQDPGEWGAPMEGPSPAGGPVLPGPAACGGQEVPPGWPHRASGEEVLALFLACASPAHFVAMQRGVDMPRLVEALEDWQAVRLGALGPLEARASAVLTRKRAAFLLAASERYGAPRAEVFALFILHSAFDDELRALLRLLGEEKQLATLGPMPSVREELRRRGLKLSEVAERPERGGDVLRGLGRAARDALASSEASAGARYVELSARRAQLPPPYQQALDEVEGALMRQHLSAGSVALGNFDSLTFGVPLGFYHLVVGTGRGAHLLSEGRYEQATRELAPAALLVGLYAGGKGLRALSEATGGGRRLPALGLEGLKGVVERLGERLGADGLGELARYLQASREAALLVCEGGEAAALALHEAKGNVARAQAWLSEAKSPRGGPTPGRAAVPSRAVAALVDEAAGLTPQVLEAKLLQVELEAPGPRLPGHVATLEKQLPSLEAPPPGVSGTTALWGEYVAYCERRLAELQQRQAVKGPLRWEGYGRMRGFFARGLAFERLMASLLRAEAALPRAQRRWLGDFEAPRVETHVGVAKPEVAGARFADVLVIEQRPPTGQPPRVESFSFKSRDLSLLGDKALTAQMVADASAALRYYGGTLNILRKALKFQAEVRRVRLIYEGGDLKPTTSKIQEAAVNKTKEKVPGVEVSFQ